MKIRHFITAVLCASAILSSAAEVTGVIVVDPKIVRKTLPTAVYDLRGIAAGDSPAAAPNKTPDNTGKFGRVAVWLETSHMSAAAPISAVMKQSNFHLEPDLLIIPTGSKVSFPNLDAVFHNIFSLSKAQSFDLGYYRQGKSRDVVFNRAGIVQVYCHIHPEMYGVIVVTPSPWTAKPSSEGTFAWPDVPPGTYRLMVWQRSSGLVRQRFVVPEAGNVQLKIALPEDDAQR